MKWRGFGVCVEGGGQRNGLGCVQCLREIEASTMALNFFLFHTPPLKGNSIATFPHFLPSV